MVLFLAAAGVAGFFVWKASRDLPDYESLAKYEPPVMTRIHAHDGSLMAEYARERRIFVPINVIPKRSSPPSCRPRTSASTSTAASISPASAAPSTSSSATSARQDRRAEGASTITQQVAKNFLLSSERTLERKLKEAILAIRIERAYSKDKILELYLNEIYLGIGSYGVAAAALNYFNKELSELTIEEAAYLAALPEGAQQLSSLPQGARKPPIRRNWIIDQMAEIGYITGRAGQGRQGQAARGQHPPARHADLCRRLLRRGRAAHARRHFGEDGLYGRAERTASATDASTAACRCAPRSIPTCSAWRARR